jgi:YebC/PmpR family DNA-binding regulatory protein
MAGHSKWANIKHRKGRQDAARGKIFSKLAKEITVIAKSEADPEKNPTLSDAIERAKSANMPKDNIDRALKRATGELPGMVFEEVTYEGYGPFGVAVLVESITDNKNRAAASIRKIFKDYGGNMEGSVAFLFQRRASLVVKLPEGTNAEDFMMDVIDLGVEDMDEDGDTVTLFASPDAMSEVKKGLEAQSIEIENAEITFVPQNTVPLEGKEAAKILKFMELLDENEDVQEVYANFDIPEETFAEMS